MSQKEKLLKRLLAKPRDFTLDEMTTLLQYLGYQPYNAGKTSGSAVKFVNGEKDVIGFHKPHPENTLKRYILEQVLDRLKEGGHIK